MLLDTCQEFYGCFRLMCEVVEKVKLVARSKKGMRSLCPLAEALNHYQSR